MSMVDKAAAFSIAAHQAIGQRRKYTDDPYWWHPANVANIVRSVPHTDEMLAAAYLHDVVEDTKVTIEDIHNNFGFLVTSYVFGLTDYFTDPKIGNRAFRKSLERERLSKVSPNVQTIKYADLIDNTSTIVAYDPRFSKVYLQEKRKLLAVMNRGNSELRKQAWRMVFNAQKELGL